MDDTIAEFHVAATRIYAFAHKSTGSHETDALEHLRRAFQLGTPRRVFEGAPSLSFLLKHLRNAPTLTARSESTTAKLQRYIDPTHDFE